MNTFNRMIDIVVAGIIMFILPLMYFEYKQTELLQRVLIQKAENFLESVINHGAVTESLYHNFMKEISINNTYLHCEIEIERKSYIFNNKEKNKTPKSYIANYGHQEIMDVLQKNKLLRLWSDDCIVINIYTTPRLLMGKQYHLVHIGGSV